MADFEINTSDEIEVIDSVAYQSFLIPDFTDIEIPVYGGTGSSSELNQAAAQRLIAARTNLTRISLDCGTQGTPADNLMLSLVTTPGGSPLGSWSFGPGENVRVDLSPYYGLVAGNTYYIQVQRSGARDTNNFWFVFSTTDDTAYPGGNLYTRNNNVWSDGGVDGSFELEWYPTNVSLQNLPAVQESITLSESVSVFLPALVPAVTENITVSESKKLELQSTSTVTDSIEVTENAAARLESLLSKTENIVLTEQISLSLPIMFSVEDSVTLSEAINQAQAHNVSTSDEVTIIEALAALESISVISSDNVEVLDEAVVSLITFVHSLLVSETITVSESTSARLESGLSVSDEIEVSEGVNLYEGLEVATSDGVELSDSLQVSLPIALNVQDATTVSDALQMFTDQLHLSVFDPVTVMELVSFQDEYIKNAPFRYSIGNNLSIMLGPDRSPIWGSNGRPQNPVQGEYGFNDETGQMEIFVNGEWKAFGFTPL